MQLRHGIDLINLQRKELKNNILAKRVLTKNEYQFYLNHSNSSWVLGVIFSCKEAVMKAFYLQYLYDDIEIKITKGPWLVHIKNQPTNLILTTSFEDNLMIASVIGHL
ncbi:4'-phosphopantetheinyl transferase superfamily protein [Ureaplasma sp. ES3154-GEN]|uniref:4'-phosphopantetheinyl transferase superfamily protein n=1 Tax=Ureaplasma sp. ES3154-GEN TaxID=2984844 RepID=UPI0021E9675C|nr:4'-phosphopantetheinyl transferase superfamily protein [Ureaplasma sp. ES3154-GEN]MCV3743296.1 4'-phosphopantetheinyl transferase superfamily protein [Ureaplasma sp. ES3154-GEN]